MCLCPAESQIYIGEGAPDQATAHGRVTSNGRIEFPAFELRGGRTSFGIEWGPITGVWSFEVSFNKRIWREQPGSVDEWTANGNAQPAGSPSGVFVEFVRPYGKWGRLVLTVSGGTGQVSADRVQGA